MAQRKSAREKISRQPQRKVPGRNTGALFGVGTAIIVIIVVSIIVSFTRGDSSPQETNTTVNPVEAAGPETQVVLDTVTGMPLPVAPVTMTMIVDRPQEYNGQFVCINGFYKQTDGTGAVADAFAPTEDGGRDLLGDALWTDVLPNEEYPGVSCDTNNPATCFGEVTVCGTLQYAPTGQDGFGPGAAYRYAITTNTPASGNNVLDITPEQ